jgi:hypothetical protein
VNQTHELQGSLVLNGVDVKGFSSTSRLDASFIGDGTVSNTEFGYLSGVQEPIGPLISNLTTAINTDLQTLVNVITPLQSQQTTNTTSIGTLNTALTALATQVDTDNVKLYYNGNPVINVSGGSLLISGFLSLYGLSVTDASGSNYAPLFCSDVYYGTANTSMSTKITSLETSVNTNATNIATLNTALTALTTRVTAIESSLAVSIVLNGNSYQLVLQNEVYTDPGAYVERLGINTGVNADPSITTINTSSIQSYSINYTATFQNVVLDPVTRSVNVVTLSLNLNGSATDYVAQGATYQDQGANVVMNEGFGSEEVVTTVYGGDLSTSTTGTKTLTYSYSLVNLIGTVSPVVRNVEVVTVTLQLNTDPTNGTVFVGGTYTDPGADLLINGVSDRTVLSDDPIDTSSAGTFDLTYSESYQNIAAAQVTRTITVVVNSNSVSATKSYIFNSSSNTFSDPTLTFPDNTVGTAVGPTPDITATTTGQVTWSAIDGISTTPTHALSLPTFTIQSGAYSFEIVVKFNDSVNQYNHPIFSMANWSDSTNTGSQGSGNHLEISMWRNLNMNRITFWVQNEVNNTQFIEYVYMSVNNNILASPSNFVHIAVTHVDNSFAKIYVNGLEQSTATINLYGSMAVLGTWTPNYVMIGRRMAAGFTGDIGNESTRYFKYYNYELTSSQVVALKNNSGV